MKTLLERYEQEAHIFEEPRRLPAHVLDNLKKARELGLLGPRAGSGLFLQMVDGSIGICSQAAVTGTGEEPMWPTAQYTDFQPDQLRAGQCWWVKAAGLLTTAASTPGNATVVARYGTSSSGTELCATPATALTANLTNAPWQLEFDFEVRGPIGAAGANSGVFGWGKFSSAAIGSPIYMSATATINVDASIAAGLYFGITLGSASDSLTTESIKMVSYD